MEFATYRAQNEPEADVINSTEKQIMEKSRIDMKSASSGITHKNGIRDKTIRQAIQTRKPDIPRGTKKRAENKSGKAQDTTIGTTKMQK